MLCCRRRGSRGCTDEAGEQRAEVQLQVEVEVTGNRPNGLEVDVTGRSLAGPPDAVGCGRAAVEVRPSASGSPACALLLRGIEPRRTASRGVRERRRRRVLTAERREATGVEEDEGVRWGRREKIERNGICITSGNCG